MKKIFLLIILVLSLPFAVNAMNFEVTSYISDIGKESFVDAAKDKNGIYVLYKGYNENNEIISKLSMLDFDYKEIWSIDFETKYILNGLFINSKNELFVYGSDTSFNHLGSSGAGVFFIYNKYGNRIKTYNRFGGYPEGWVHTSTEIRRNQISSVTYMYEYENGYALIGPTIRYMYGTMGQTTSELEMVVFDKSCNVVGINSFTYQGKTISIDNFSDGTFGGMVLKKSTDLYFRRARISSINSNSGSTTKSLTDLLPNDFEIDKKDNIYAVGADNSIATIVKYDFAGELVWKKQLPGTGDSHFIDVDITSDGKIVVVGKSKSTDSIFKNNGEYDAIICVYDENGELLLIKNYGDKYSEGIDRIQFIDNYNFVMGGTTTSKCINDKCSKSAEGETKIFLVSGKLGYDIFVEEDKAGRVVTGQTNDKGYVVIAPNFGYLIETVIAKDDKGNVLTVSNDGDNKYSFDLNSDVYVKVTYKQDYKVVVNSNKGGKHTFDKISENNGRVIIEPEEGYEIDNVIIKDTTEKEVIYEVKENGYYFEIKEDLTVTIVFKELPKEVVKGEEIENPQTADAFIYYACAVVCSLFGVWSVEQYRKNKKSLQQ